MINVPEGIGEKAMHLLVALYSEQEHVKVEYEVVKNEQEEKETA